MTAALRDKLEQELRDDIADMAWKLRDELRKLIDPSLYGMEAWNADGTVSNAAWLLSRDFFFCKHVIGNGRSAVWTETKTVTVDGKDKVVENRHVRTFKAAVSEDVRLSGNPNNTVELQCALDRVLEICFDLNTRFKLSRALFPHLNRRLQRIEIERNDEGKVLVRTFP